MSVFNIQAAAVNVCMGRTVGVLFSKYFFHFSKGIRYQSKLKNDTAHKESTTRKPCIKRTVNNCPKHTLLLHKQTVDTRLQCFNPTYFTNNIQQAEKSYLDSQNFFITGVRSWLRRILNQRSIRRTLTSDCFDKDYENGAK